MRFPDANHVNPRAKEAAARVSWTGLLAIFALLAVSVIGAGKRQDVAKPSIVWPAAPEPARVAFVQSVTRPADLGAKVSGFRRFANWVTGDSAGNQPFVKPFGLALDDAGNLCLTDTGNQTVGYYDAKARRWLRWEKVDKLRFSIAGGSREGEGVDLRGGQCAGFDHRL
jgi:hypothetical protein